jgi:phage-related protein
MVEAILSYVVRAIDETSSVMDKIKASMGLVGSALGDLGGGFTSVGNIMQGFAGAGVVGAVSAGLGEVIKGLEASVKQATDTEKIFTSLGAAVERSGVSWKSVQEGCTTALEAMERTTTYSKDEMAGALERLMTYGLSYNEAMKALGATIDFAAAKHMDLESAATLVGKAVDGNTGIMKRYGVDITEAKDATDKFTPVLTALNDQFGGAAQAAASTYAGTQERLNHAWAEVSEKVGNILLPALTSITEAMIPVADQFGKGVDAVSAWLAEVGKMPEVQGFMAAVSDAFKGFWGYLQDLWAFIQESFGPAIKELLSAFKDLWDALSPIGDALKELLGAFGDTGNIDLLKTALEFVVIQIRAVAFIIKEVSPYIKAFAEAFKEAADFITPILTTMVGDIRIFIDALKTIFQDFYNWLIGRSLWRDLWDAMQTFTSEMVSKLLALIRETFLQALRTAFETVTQAIRTVWDSAWTAMQTTFTTISTAIQAAWISWTDYLRDTMITFWSTVQAVTSDALAAIRAAFSAAMAAIEAILSGAISTMQGMWQGFASFMTSAISAFQSSVSAAASFLNSILGSMQGAASAALGAVQSSVSSAVSFVSSTVSTMQSAASSALSSVGSAFSDTWNAITSGAQDLWNTLVGGSVWTDMLAKMESQTYLALGNITDAFKGMSLTIPAAVPYSAGASSPAGASTTIASTIPVTLTNTIPVTVKMDGQTIAKTVESRIVNSVVSKTSHRGYG